MRGKTPNRLIGEKSPYLLQHAYNPVDWFPWGEEAFARARSEDKPIFLSVGYSTCHWCHVMERESFESDNVAAILNEHFVAIKVDREERPDIDRIYMTSLQATGQQGGWPMSMFLTPDLKPFYGGTYFPPETRHGRAGFPDILRRIHEVWVNERQKVQESAERLRVFLEDAASFSTSAGEPGREVLELCREQLSQTYDDTNGGFGGGPKFPRPVVFRFLFQHHRRGGDARALEMAEQTLQKMALGGVYDHVGGGFHRYAVDAEWRVPHFEKMLYDQAQLLHAYMDAYQLTGKQFYAHVAREVAEYVLRDMTHPEGGFFSAEDADSTRPDVPSEKGEGAFYVWTKEEISRTLGNLADVFNHCYGVKDGGNAPVDPQREFVGRNILYVAHSIKDTALVFNLEEEQVRSMLALARHTLLRERSTRPRPHLDDKILAGWNGLMIGALARVGAVLGREDCTGAAARAAEFILNNLASPETGLLLRRFRDGDARFEGHLEDYAFLTEGLIELYQATLTPRWLEAAIRLTADSVKMFHDPDRGGFYETSGHDPSVIVRLKEQHDGAEPTGNSAQVHNLLRLGHAIGDERLCSLAEGTFRLFASTLTRQPVVMPNMAAALDVHLRGPLQVVVTGDPGSQETASLLREVRMRYLPGALLLATGTGSVREQMERLVPQLRGFSEVGDVPTAYVCRNFTCQLPVTDAASLARQLEVEAGCRKTKTPAV